MMVYRWGEGVSVELGWGFCVQIVVDVQVQVQV